MNKYEKIMANWNAVDRSTFAVEIAKVMLELKSSHCYFIIQQAFDKESCLGWDDIEKVLEKLTKGGG
jgi:hypothetical protein